MKRILVVMPNWIGDAVMAQPFLMLLKKQYPHAQIHALAPHTLSDVLAYMPEIDQCHSTELAHGKLQLRRRWKLARQLRLIRYDCAYVLPNSAKSALIPWLAGIPQRIGYHGEQRYGLLHLRHANPSRRDKRFSMVQHYAALAYSAGMPLPAMLPHPCLSIDKTAMIRCAHRFQLQRNIPLIVLCPCAEYGSAKRWPVEHFATLAHHIRKTLPSARILVLGSSKEDVLGQSIFKCAPFVQNLCGHTHMSEACALLAHAQAVVTNDSGLMHITAALKRPLIALYGSTDPRHTPPLSDKAHIQWLHLDCSPCFARECPLGHFKCLRELSPEQVFAALHQLLKE